MNAAPAPPLQWTEAPPIVPGWYWRRDANGIRAEYLSIPPQHWEDRQSDVLSYYASEDALGRWPGHLQTLGNTPDSAWLIEWAGPLVPPV